MKIATDCKDAEKLLEEIEKRTCIKWASGFKPTSKIGSINHDDYIAFDQEKGLRRATLYEFKDARVISNSEFIEILSALMRSQERTANDTGKIETIVEDKEQFINLMKRINSETDGIWIGVQDPTRYPAVIVCNDKCISWHGDATDRVVFSNKSFMDMLKIEKVEKISYKVEKIGEFGTIREAVEAIENSNFAEIAMGADFYEQVVQCGNGLARSGGVSLAMWLRANKNAVIDFLGKE